MHKIVSLLLIVIASLSVVGCKPLLNEHEAMHGKMHDFSFKVLHGKSLKAQKEAIKGLNALKSLHAKHFNQCDGKSPHTMYEATQIKEVAK